MTNYTPALWGEFKETFWWEYQHNYYLPSLFADQDFLTHPIWFNVHFAFNFLNFYINYSSFISYFFTCNFLIASRQRTSVSPSMFHIEKLKVRSSHPYGNAVLHLPFLVNELLINTLKSYFSWPRAELKVGRSLG